MQVKTASWVLYLGKKPGLQAIALWCLRGQKPVLEIHPIFSQPFDPELLSILLAYIGANQVCINCSNEKWLI